MLVFEHLVACVRPALPWATASTARKARRKCGIVYLFCCCIFCVPFTIHMFHAKAMRCKKGMDDSGKENGAGGRGDDGNDDIYDNDDG